jgi:ABC-type glycerol-3-phosphate transport system substrate-binding protein
MARTPSLWLALVLVLVIAAIACGCMGTAPATTAGDIKKFGSQDEIRQYIKENTAKV